VIAGFLCILVVGLSGFYHGRKMYDLGREHGRLERVAENQSAAARAAKRWGMQ
jgi:hypothetical protein